MRRRRKRNSKQSVADARAQRKRLSVPLADKLPEPASQQSSEPKAAEESRAAAPGESFAQLVKVKPLRGVARFLPPVPSTDTANSTVLNHGQGGVAFQASDFTFTIERSAERIEAYRTDLGPVALRLLSGRTWHPHVMLDLHGRRASEVRQVLLRAVSAIKRGRAVRVLIVHGKGLHSKQGTGVLQHAAVDALTEPPLAVRVRAFATAPLRLGGSGALCVEVE